MVEKLPSVRFPSTKPKADDNNRILYAALNITFISTILFSLYTYIMYVFVYVIHVTSSFGINCSITLSKTLYNSPLALIYAVFYRVDLSSLYIIFGIMCVLT